MDTTIKGIDISKNKMIKILDEIFAIDLHDNVKFKITDIPDIREEDEYGGNKYHILAKKGNMRDYTDLLHLVILNNLQNINAELIEEKVPQIEYL